MAKTAEKRIERNLWKKFLKAPDEKTLARLLEKEIKKEDAKIDKMIRDYVELSE